MRKILVIFCLLISNLILAQGDPREGRHVFNYPITLTQTNFDGSPIVGKSPKIETMERDWIFTIENIIGGTDYVIQIARFTSGSTEAEAQNLKTFQENSVDIFFKLSISQYNSVAERLPAKGSFIVGTNTTLIKVRPGNNKEGDERIYSEFGNDFNIGLTAGWKFDPSRKNDLTVSGVGGIAFGATKVTPQTTKGFVTSESTQTTITYNGGFVFEMDNFQLSVFLGVDTMSGEVGSKWIYRNRPWFGLGFGYEVFQQKGKTEN